MAKYISSQFLATARKAKLLIMYALFKVVYAWNWTLAHTADKMLIKIQC